MNPENMQIIAISFAIFLIIALWAVGHAKPVSTSAEYFTAKGQLDKRYIFFSVFATAFSAFSVVGLPAMFYVHGVGTFWFMWVGIALTPLTLRIIGTRIITFSLANPGYSSPVGLLTAPYKSSMLTRCAAILSILVLVPYLVLQIAGVGKFLVSLSNGGVSYSLGTVLCCVIVGLYLYKGGALADARTDYAQGIMLIVGTILFGILVVHDLSSNFSESSAKLRAAGLLDLPGPKGYFTLPLLFSFGVVFTLISVATPQLSQKLMGVTSNAQLRPLYIWYPIAGSVIVILACITGFYAAANLRVSNPDFVIGDVLRHFSSIPGSRAVVFWVISVCFVSGIVAAAVSTIDSLLLAVAGIFDDMYPRGAGAKTSKRAPLLMAAVLGISLILSFNPPRFIVDLAKIQLSGLMALLPCLLAPLYNIKSRLGAG